MLAAKLAGGSGSRTCEPAGRLHTACSTTRLQGFGGPRLTAIQEVLRTRSRSALSPKDSSPTFPAKTLGRGESNPRCRHSGIPAIAGVSGERLADTEGDAQGATTSRRLALS
jgi:hypothetical protein